jgi:hypothetical protein
MPQKPNTLSTFTLGRSPSSSGNHETSTSQQDLHIIRHWIELGRNRRRRCRFEGLKWSSLTPSLLINISLSRTFQFYHQPADISDSVKCFPAYNVCLLSSSQYHDCAFWTFDRQRRAKHPLIDQSKMSLHEELDCQDI